MPVGYFNFMRAKWYDLTFLFSALSSSLINFYFFYSFAFFEDFFVTFFISGQLYNSYLLALLSSRNE